MFVSSLLFPTHEEKYEIFTFEVALSFNSIADVIFSYSPLISSTTFDESFISIPDEDPSINGFNCL